MSGTLNLTIEQGATFTKALVWECPADTPVNITGYSAVCVLAKTYDADDDALTLTSAVGGGITLGTTDGAITITLNDEQTDALEAWNYVWALELTSPAGVVTRLVEGTATVTPKVPRA